ncbi:MAG: GTP pyrophosphokinase family protein [Mycoplasmatota bacterium]|nr:GTP pyrophosphokinase family protein [Mycoplasmatota bacterium]
MFINDKEIKALLLRYNFGLKILKTSIEILVSEFEYKYEYNPVEHTKSRIKSLDSAAKKLERKGLEVTPENIRNYVHDMIGVRIVCSFLSDVYEIVDRIRVSSRIIVKEESDYIKNPKRSGYTSYHMNVLVPIDIDNTTEYVEAEIQIRTVSMDCWASLDHKLRYKLPKTIPEYIENSMYERALEMMEHDRKMQILNDMVKGLKKDKI